MRYYNTPEHNEMIKGIVAYMNSPEGIEKIRLARETTDRVNEDLRRSEIIPRSTLLEPMTI